VQGIGEEMHCSLSLTKGQNRSCQQIATQSGF